MKILEKLAISFILFLIIYAFVSIGLRILALTTVYASHMIGGIIATLASISLLMYFLLKMKA